MRKCLTAVFVVVVGTLATAAQQADPGARRPLRPNRVPVQTPAVTPAEIQRMFDAYALVQAQDQLRLSDEQYSRFLIRYKALQDARRQLLQQRARSLAELRRLLVQGEGDEGRLEQQMHALREADARGAADVQKAHDGVDEVLDTRQQAMFRVFEEQMERRKLELLTRARQGNRANPPQQ
jgi:hypothetical protein